ncbi:MAG: M1 family metallopeptidase [Caldilineales bacterium]|nr:M1 family metallopeptidase [Caldilineales bacterium]
MKPTVLRLAVWGLTLILLTACGRREIVQNPYAVFASAWRSNVSVGDFVFGDAPRYDILMSVDPDNRRLEGTALVRLRNLSGRPLNDLYLRLYPNLPQLGGTMQLTGVVVLPERYPAGFAYTLNNTAARITLPQPLPADQPIALEVAYRLEAPQKTGYVLFGESEGILNLPYAYPMVPAQTRDPASPWRLEIPPPHGDIAVTDPSLFVITATVPAAVTLVATGVEITHSVGISDTIQRVLVAGPAPEFAMTLSRHFQHERLTLDDIVINSYFLPQDRLAGRAALADAAAAVRVFGQLFAPYPFTELDVVQAPTRYLGMEYPGLNYIGLDTYRSQSESQEILVAHEVAHQWWYALVGSDPFRYPWLDEGLAEHSSLLFMDTLYGPDVADRIRTLRWRVPTEWAVKNDYDAPVGQDVTAFNGTNYEILVYAKSALFFDALYQTLGFETYLKVLKTFVERYRLQRPTPADFLAVVAEVGGIDPQPLYEQWILSGPQRQVTPTPPPGE